MLSERRLPPEPGARTPAVARSRFHRLTIGGTLAISAATAFAAYAAQSRQAIADPETVRLDSRAMPATVEAYWTGAAQCLRPAEKLEEDIATGLTRMTRFSPLETRTIRGLQFENRPRVLLDAFEALVANAPAAGLARAAGCATVSCAVGRIFGQKEGDRILYLLIRYGYNASHLGDRNAVAWELEELNDLLLALGDFPAATIPFHGMAARPLIEQAKVDKLATSAGLDAAQVVALNEESDKVGIRVGPVWETQPQATRRASIFHEVVHDYFRAKANEADTIRRWTGAMVADSVWARNTRRPLAVSTYATGSIAEDFAESASAYRYAPELLKVRSPKRYDLLRRGLFDGLEYTDAASCQPERSYTARATAAARALMGFTRMSSADAEGAMRACLDSVHSEGGAHSLTVARACMGREVLRVALRANLSLIMSPNDPVDRELLVDRLSNQPYMIETAAAMNDADLLDATKAARANSCGGACHVARLGTAGRWRPDER